MTTQTHTLTSRSTKIANYLAAAVLILVPFHAFLTVWFSSFVGHYTALRLWDDCALLALIGLALTWLGRDGVLRRVWSTNVLVRLILAYTALTLLLGAVALIKREVRLEALGYGLLVNLRYVGWFLAVALLAARSSFLGRNWHRLILVPAAVVVIFGALQYAVLPHNFLSHFGYSASSTIPPIETINHNAHYIRAQSTLRGANPLGAYLVIISSALAVLAVRSRRWLVAGLFGVLTLFTLYATGSRSAWVGTVVAIAVALWLVLKSKRARQLAGALGLGVVVLFVIAVVLLRNHTGVENALLHTQKHSAIATTSNAAHASALKQGLSDVRHQPFGDGPGTAGQASAYNAPHPTRIAEDYYIQIAQEVGWLGLALFIAVLGIVARELYHRRSSTIALVALVSLVGISFVCLLSHAWSDDTLAFTWWGLAGIALGESLERQHEI